MGANRMLIQRAEFTDARELTNALSDRARWTTEALLAEDTVAHEADRTAGLLAAWADILAAAVGDGPAVFVAMRGSSETWVKLGQSLVETACRGNRRELEDAARHAASELDVHGRARLIAHLAEIVPSMVGMAGGIDTLLELDSLHQLSAGAEELWVSTAAWMIGALSELHRNEMGMRLASLVADDRGPDLWRTWLQVAATVIPAEAVAGFQPRAMPSQFAESYPRELAKESITAAHCGDADRIAQSHAQFNALSHEAQVLLEMDLAMMIATIRRLSRHKKNPNAGGPAEPSPRSADRDELREIASTIMDAMPAEVVERTGRMHALARRAVLAFMDEDSTTLAAIVDRIATWESKSGHSSYPDPPFRFPAEQSLTQANDLFQLGLQYGFGISKRAVADGAIELIDRLSPPEHREAARDLLTKMKRAGLDQIVEVDQLDDAPGFLAAAASAAWLASNRTIFKARETVRLSLIKEIRESEAKALRVPDREQITDISDDEALGFLERMYGDGYPLPRDPDERALWELDIVAVIKQHLLEVPADATTNEQLKELDARVKRILQAAAGTPQQAPKKERAPVSRKQPKRQPKRKRK
ncbi:hypothetical protein [Streptomyces sp. CT34]|uniref:hypothetical protein n=1 Tax=Streptomyces sp. CT34 TaxID=1553907 RepID=UPI0005B7979F|nr:hypothetical protein [Streptomyces sp. CT34]